MDTRLEAKAKDAKKIRGQGQECSRPRPRTKDTNASVFLRKKVFKNFFGRSSKKNSPEKHFSADLQNFNHSKIVLSSSRGQDNFRGLEASRPRPRTSKCVLEDVLEAKDVLENSTSVNYTYNVNKLTDFINFR